MDDPSTPVEPAAARRRWPFWLAGCAVLLAGLALLLAAPFTQRGSLLLLGLVPGLQVVDLQGSLLGGALRIGQIRYRLDPTQSLVLDQLDWRGLRLERQRLHLTELTLARIDVQGPSASTQPLQLPKALVLPWGVQIDQVRIGELLLDAIRDRPVQDIRLALRLDAGTPAQHRIDNLQLHWDRLQAAGALSLGASAPLPLGARLQLQSRPDAAAGTAPAVLTDTWQAELQASGPLADFSLSGNLQARRQQLALTAQVQPQAAIPLTQLSATARQLDLAALASGLPGTALSGTLSARLDPAASTGHLTPLSLQIDLNNERPARIDQQGIPLQRLQLQASSDLKQPGQGEIGMLLLDFAAGNQPAGRLQGRASWALQGAAASRQLALTLDARLDALQPARLDQRAPALLASGPLQLGLRQPWPAPAPTTPVDAAVQPPAPPARPASAVSWPPAGEFDPAQPLLSLHTELTGHAVAAELPVVRLQLQAAANPTKLLLQSLRAEAGTARLRASGRAEHPAKGSWHVVLDSELNAFDPARWWPGAPGSAWQRGPHRLDGTLQADLTLPPGRPQPDGRRLPLPGGAARLAALQGQARLSLHPSLLAGLPLTGELTIAASHPPGQAAAPVHAGLTLRLGPAAGASTLQLSGDLDSVGSQDRWQLRWDSPELATLRPWLHLTGTTAPPELSGDSHGEVSVSGRWPELHSQGSLRSSRLRLDPAQELLGLALQWRAGSQLDDPLDLQARLEQARSGAQRLDGASLNVQGSARAHQLQLQARLQPASPAASANGTNSTTGPAMRPLQLQAHADGGWISEPAAQLHGWQGQLGEVLLRDAPPPPGATPVPAASKPDAASAPASAAAGVAAGVAAPAGRVWLQHRGPTPIRLTRTPQALQLGVGASRVQLLDASLVLDQLDWQRLASPAAEQLTLRARLEPLAIAPLLARWQPGFGWRGDLQLAGRIDVHASPGRMQADAELQRQGGDLVVIDPDNPERPLQRLGLSELRLALQADAGRWRLSQRIVGSSLGSLSGEQTVQTNPGALWPAADAPLDGGIDLRVSELGQWGRWLPAGWRLSGQLNTQAHLSGRFGAPELSGELHGQQIAVRNLLQGINWTDARLSVALQGETARIEEFSVKAGTGSVTGHGSATLGQAPRATLQLHADHFAALQRVDRRVVVSGDAELQLDPRTLRLSGRLRADEGRIDVSQRDAPSLSDDVVVLREAPAATPEGTGPAAPETTQRNTVIDLSADLGNAFELRGRGISTRLTGELRLTNPAGRLAMRGTIATDDGTYAAYGQKLGIDRGLIIFVGAADNPRLDIVATRPDLDGLRVGVAISGTAQSPRVRLFSDPEMGDTDKLSWLILGRASDGLGGTDLALLQRAAYALYAGEDDSPSLIQRIGLDELSVRQADGTVRDTVVSLGKQLSRRWYVGYERGLNATSGTWQLIYRIAQRFTLRAQSSASDRALDLIWTWKWGPPSPQLPPIEPPPAPARPASSS